MKKQLLGLMTILTILNACQKNDVSVSLPEAVTIHATIEEKDATKTIMDENNNILWSENDQIMAFMKSSYGHKYQVKPSFVGKSYADFSMVSSGNGNDLSAGNEWEHNVVYYPYSENIECLKSGSNYELEVNLPTEQVYVPNSFANGSMAMVAVSENNNITFNNVLGAIKLQLKGTQTVKSIKIEGKNNEKLSGAAIVAAYTDDTKPAITMASGASTSVTLNCGSGAQLNESKATEFIISLPPVLFSKGFIVTITDSDSKTHVVETDKANTVLRSSLLIMPVIKVGSEQIPDEDIDVIPISKITLDRTSLSLPLNFSYLLIAKIAPIDATNQKVTWSSDNPSIVTVDQTGRFTTISAGEANILAEADGHYGSCKIVVIPQKTELVDYIDEYGVNHGKGVALGDIVWAPVNCGYKAKSSNSKGFPYGKLYQWGRRYGQGYDLTYDESEPNIIEGPISLNGGMSKEYENVFFSVDNYGKNWISTDDIKQFWNSGTEESPIKTQYDPCPDGWRVPTESELRLLIQARSSKETINNQYGYCYSGCYSYIDSIQVVFLPAAGYRMDINGKSYDRQSGGNGSYWGVGHYWSSTAYNKGESYYNYYWKEYFECSESLAYTYYYNSGNVYYQGLADGKSIRCVQE
jgi:uncharacterized protein (TIGR02145 family)